MGSCRQVEAELDRYIDDELDSEARSEIEAHLADCPECNCALQERRAAMGMLAEWAGEPAFPARAQAAGRRSGLLLALAAAAVLLAVGVPLGLYLAKDGPDAHVEDVAHGKLKMRNLASGVKVVPSPTGGPVELIVDPFPEEGE